MGVLGIISLIVSSILLMTSFFWKDIDSGITITLSALGIGGAEFIITWLVTGAKISFDN